jgi:hypothetical protein
MKKMIAILISFNKSSWGLSFYHSNHSIINSATPPPLLVWMGFGLHCIHPIFILSTASLLLSLPHLHYLVSKIACRSHLSTFLHNTSLPLDKTTFPSALKLFFATGLVEPP